MGSSWVKKAVTMLVATQWVCISAHALEVVDGYYPAYPATPNATNAQASLIKKGEYLSKMGDCIACHTNVKAGTPAFAGGLPIATPFGTFYTPNITPDKETGIGRWTEQDFVRAMKEGRNPSGGNYFPVFPFVYFANMTDDDARALYAYFMSLAPVTQKNKSLPFPFNVPGARLSLWGWKLLFFYPNPPLTYDTSRSPEWNRGHYIVDGLGHCSMCHTPLNPLGAPETRHYLTGGFIDGYWAPNITRLGLISEDNAGVAKVFSENRLLNNAGPVAGPMADVNHNSLRYLTNEDQLAIATYLKTVDSQEKLGVKGSTKAPTLARGKEVYYSACTICHQNGEMGAPRLGDGDNLTLRMHEQGLNGLYQHVIQGYNSMPYRGACVTCSDQDIMSAVDYLLDASLTHSQRLDLASHRTSAPRVSGEHVYEEKCSVCHREGKSGAPKVGDQAVWKPLIAQNIDVLVENTLHGPKHPHKGACHDCSTADVLAAIKYMVEQSKTEGQYSLW